MGIHYELCPESGGSRSTQCCQRSLEILAGTWWRVLAGRGAASMWRAVAAPHVCPGVNLCIFHCARRTRNRTMPAPPALAQLDLLLLSWTKRLHNSVMSARLLGDAGRKLAQDRRTKIRLHTEHICFIRTKGQDSRKLTADQAHVIVRKCGCIALARNELHVPCPAARPISLDMRIVVAASAARFLDAAKMSPGIKLFGDTVPPLTASSTVSAPRPFVHPNPRRLSPRANELCPSTGNEFFPTGTGSHPGAIRASLSTTAPSNTRFRCISARFPS